MPGCGKPDFNLIIDIKFPRRSCAYEKLHTAYRIILDINWLYRCLSTTSPFLVVHLGITFLDMTAVGEHNRTQVACCICADHRSSEAQSVNKRNQSRMVNVGMCQYNMVDLAGFKSQVPVHAISLLTFSLEHSAVEKDLFSAVKRDQCFTAGYFACGPYEFNLHDTCLLYTSDAADDLLC